MDTDLRTKLCDITLEYYLNFTVGRLGILATG